MSTNEAITAIKNCLEKNLWGCGEDTEAFVFAMNELSFLNFLFNVIQPNEMEQYLNMYNSRGEKQHANINKISE